MFVIDASLKNALYTCFKLKLCYDTKIDIIMLNYDIMSEIMLRHNVCYRCDTQKCFIHML